MASPSARRGSDILRSGVLRSGFAAAALAAILAALILGSMEIERARDTRSLQALESMAASDRALQHDVLLVRAGLLRNYDPLVFHERAIEDDLRALRGAVRRDRLDPVALQG